jgi:hypothetical protein
MRFCPFCSAENVREATHCQMCARRLPPLAPRRPRPATAEPPSRSAADGHESAPGGEGDEPSTAGRGAGLESVSLGPGTRRARAPASEPPSPGGPARRDGDMRPKSVPPLPHRGERERVAGLAPRPPSRPEIPLALRPPEKPVTARREDDGPASRPRVEPRPPADEPDEEAAAPVAAREEPKNGVSASDAREPSDGGDKRRASVSETTTAAPAAATRGESVVAEVDDEVPATRGESEVIEAADDAAPATRGGPAVREADDEVLATDEPLLPRLGLETVSRDVSLPSVMSIPDTPGPGLHSAARYAIQFGRARLQRRRVIAIVRSEIRDDTASLDAELGSLGRRVRELGLEAAPLADENRAIDEAEARREEADHACATLMSQQAEEKAKFAEIEAEKQAKVSEAEEALDRAQRELASLEAQRRGLRDKRKAVERQQKGYLKAADDREAQAAKAELQQAREALRRGAVDLRRDAAGLEPELRDLERRVAALEVPIGDASARVDALKAELESVRRSLGDARDGHRHRLAELESEQNRRGRELSQADAEIQRRLVTLGTIVNLNRIERSELRELYGRVDELRVSIGMRSRFIDQLTAESEAYDRGSLVRGIATLAGGLALALAILAALWAIL